MECVSVFALLLGLTGLVGLAVAATALREVRALRDALAVVRSQLFELLERRAPKREEEARVGEGRPVEQPAAVSGLAAAVPAAQGPLPAPAVPFGPPALTATAAATGTPRLPAEAAIPQPAPTAGGTQPPSLPAQPSFSRAGAETPEPPLTAAAVEPPSFPTQPSFSGGGGELPAARREAGFEERLGARAFVWIGSIALALAGAFLVKYSIDQGWIGPAVRLTLAILFGVSLLAAGEALRARADRIASGLSAAGIAVLFAAWLAGVNLYHLISPALGFTFLAITAALGVLLSLRQGPIVALVGLAGGFLTPALIHTARPDARVLFAYLLLLEIGMLATARRRRWSALPELAVLGGLVWVVVWLQESFAPGDSLWLGLFLIGSVGAVAGVERLTAPAAGDSLGGEPPAEQEWRLSALAAGGPVLTMALVTARADYTPLEWAFQAVLIAAALSLARQREELHALAWLAAGTAFALFAVWGWDLPEDHEPRFLWTVLAIGVLCAAGGYAAHFGAPRPGRWTALASAAGLAFFFVAWTSATTERPRLPWGALALTAAALYLLAALPVGRRRAAATEEAAAHVAPALAWLAVAVTSFVSLAVSLELERAWWTVAWALEVPALVWLAGRFRLPVLRQLAALLAAGVAVRLLLNPDVLTYPIGTRPVVNWLPYGYGIPLLALGGAAALARRDESFGPGRLAPLLEAIGLGLALALVTLEVRQGFHPGQLGQGEPGLVEWATYTVAWLALGMGALAAGWRLARPTLEWGGRGLLLLGAGCALLGSSLALNPLWQHEAVGETPIANWLLWIYGAPALLAALAGRELRRRGETLLAAAGSVAALLLVFLLVTLEVTQAFHGAFLDDEPAGAAEKYAYSAAWLVFGVALLLLGIARRVRALRYASLAVMSLTVGKVFLFDTGHLTDLYRVLSFLGLGLSLLLLAYLYQRFVFREPAA